MRYAIIESGGKQYRAVEGFTIDVDRLAQDVGKKFDIERVLLMGDGDDFMIGTPAVSGISVTAKVVEHVKGPKVTSFRYRPKKRIRVKGGHRHQYTRLMIESIGKPGEVRKVEKPADRAAGNAEARAQSKSARPAKGPKKDVEKASARKPAAKPTSTKSSAKPAAKKSDSKKK